MIERWTGLSSSSMNRRRGYKVVYDKQQQYSIELEPLSVNINEAKQHEFKIKIDYDIAANFTNFFNRLNQASANRKARVQRMRSLLNIYVYMNIFHRKFVF